MPRRGELQSANGIINNLFIRPGNMAADFCRWIKSDSLVGRNDDHESVRERRKAAAKYEGA